MSKPTTCKGRTKKGKPCTRKASNGGYCYQHGASASEAGLTEKQRRFVEAYMGAAAGNATEAARLAGYGGDENTLSQTGHQNLRNPKISEAINERVDSDPLVMTRFDRQRFWSRVVQGKELDGEDPAQMRDRLKASELLAKAQGDFIERVEHTGKGGGPIITASGADLSMLSTDDLAELEGILEKIENE